MAYKVGDKVWMDNLYRLGDRFQYVDARDLKPYKENAK